MPDLILSSSSISSYLQCHYRYLLGNVYRIGGGQSIAAALGTSVHAAVEAFWGTSPLRPQAVLERVLTAELAKVPILDEAPAAVLLDGQRMLRTYISTVAPTFTPTMVEKTFVITVDGAVVAGTIDTADDSDVRDIKTTSMISKFDALAHTLQLTLYSLGYRVLTGHPPRKLLLDVLPRGGRVTYRQYEVQPEMNELIDVLGLVRDGILREDWDPTGAIGGACHYCPYRLVCKFSTEKV
jgi:RecB family exonuclease